MKKNIIIASATVLLLTACGTPKQQQQFWKDVNKVATQVGNTQAGTALTNDEVIRGLKEALVQGTSKSSTKLSLLDGFFKDAAVKILMPPDAANVETKLRELGFGNLVDNAILSFNRGAEDAALKAKPIFVNAITGMTIQDAMGILKGGGTSATDFLKRTTTAQLKTAFRPVIEQSLQKVNATKYWSDVMGTYNKIPFVQKVNPDLAGFVTDRAVAGVFLKIADEEKNIRANPAARATDLLKKVFGNIPK